MRSRSTAAVALAVALLLGGWTTGCGGDDGDDGDAARPEPTTTERPAPAPPYVIGHRGASGHFPDNTIEGIEGAAELGAEWVEIDVRLSADGDVVLSHDPVTGDGSLVSATSTEDLAAEDVPTLAAVLGVTAELGLGLNIEIKAIPTEEDFDPSLTVVDATLEYLEAAEYGGDLVISSFNRDAIDRVRELAADEIDTFLIASGTGDSAVLAADLASAGHEGLAIEGPDLPAGFVEPFTAAGLDTWAWTIDDPADARALVGAGVVGIITDYPDRIAEALDEG